MKTIAYNDNTKVHGRRTMKEHLKDMCEYLTANKCKDVSVYDVSKEGHDCEYIFVATISSQMASKKLSGTMMRDFQIQEFPEGYHKGEWVVFDLGQYVVHVFIPSARPVPPINESA